MNMHGRQREASGGGIGFYGMLAILFIALKLTEHVDWAWWVVLSPIWGYFALCAIVLAVAAIRQKMEERRWR